MTTHLGTVFSTPFRNARTRRSSGVAARVIDESCFEYVIHSAVAGYGSVAAARATIVLNRLATIIDRLDNH